MKNRKIFIFISVICIFLIFTIGGTYAYLYLGKNNNSVTGKGYCNSVVYEGTNINASNLVSTTNYLEGSKTDVTLSYSKDCSIYTLASIYLHTNDETTSPITSVHALKYKVFNGSTKISEGVITSKGDVKIATVPLTDTATTYNVYLYIDSNVSNGYFDNKTYSGYIYASTAQTSTINSFLVRDLSYSTNDGTAYGATWDKPNGVVTTDGLDDYVNLGLINYDFKNAVTLISRFKLLKNNNTTENEIINNYDAAGVGLTITTDNDLFFQIYSKELSAYKRVVYSSAKINYNQWYTAVGTYDGATMKLYVNGNLVNSASSNGTIKVSPCPLYLGANPNLGSAGDDMFSSFTYSDVLVYNKVLSESEVKSVFSSTVDSSKVDKAGLLVYYDFK